MTQQEIVNAVNRLAVTQTISWQDIKYDADGAILKINSYLGTRFPKMSDVMTGPHSTYSIKHEGKYIPIFDYTYIRTIVVPFIASELLARDEEFTTIYNKYVMDVDNNLYVMYSNEFNRIPDIFKQDKFTGMFISSRKNGAINAYTSNGLNKVKTREAYVLDEIERGLPTFKLHVHYNHNLHDAFINRAFFDDTNRYDIGDEVVLKDIPGGIDALIYYSKDGLYKYELSGWCRDEQCTSDFGESFNIFSDTEVYAKWDKTTKFNVVQGTGADALHYYLVMPSGTPLNIPCLFIPKYFNGFLINALDSRLINGSQGGSTIHFINIPETIELIKSGTFDYAICDEIKFPETGHITIESGGLHLFNSNIQTNEYKQYPLILPKSIESIDTTSFGLVDNTKTPTRTIDIYCDYNKDTRPADVFPNLDDSQIFICYLNVLDSPVIKYVVHFANED